MGEIKRVPLFFRYENDRRNKVVTLGGFEFAKVHFKKWCSVSEQRSPGSEYYSKGLLFAVLFRRVCSIMFSCVTYLETSNNTFDVFCSIVICGPYYLIFFFRRFKLKGLKVRLMVLNVRFMKTFSC